MGQFTTNVSIAEPLGFIVYIQTDSKNLSMAEFSNISGLDISQMLSLLSKTGGFPAEPDDAIGFFLNEDYANEFANNILLQD